MTTNATDILLRAHANNRLHHALLLYGPDTASLADACALVASKILGVASPEKVASHPDFFAARPANKSRTISVEDTREIVRQVQQTANAGGRKVAVFYDADRMKSEAANTFLKTLEEPPGDTTIFLLTTRPSHLLDTVRSRCLHFHIPQGNTTTADPAWEEWLIALDDWVVSLTEPAKNGRERVAGLIFTLYNLLSCFEHLLEVAVGEIWSERKATLVAAGLDKEEIEAEEAGLAKDIRARRVADIALRLCAVYARRPDAAGARALHTSVMALERASHLAELNLKAPSDLEYALLVWLRAWSAK